MEKLQKAGIHYPDMPVLCRIPSFDPLRGLLPGYWSVSGYRQRTHSFSHDYYCEQLRRTVRQLKNTKNYFPGGYFDINPGNPTGLVRDEQQTRDIAGILKEAVDHTYNRIGDILKRAPDPAYPWFTIIDDRIYEGLEHGNKKPFGFAQLPEWADKTHTIFGVSKYGLVGMRSAIVVGPSRHIAAMREHYNREHSDIHLFPCWRPNLFSARARKIWRWRVRPFAGKPIITNWLAGLRGYIDGERKHPLSDGEKRTAYEWFKTYGGCEEKDIHAFFSRGMRGIKVALTPEAGFFLTLNIASLMRRADEIAEDRCFSVKSKDRFARLQRFAFEKHQLYIGSSDYICVQNADALIRFSIAVPPKELVARLLGLRHMANDVYSVPRAMKIDLRDTDIEAGLPTLVLRNSELAPKVL